MAILVIPARAPWRARNHIPDRIIDSGLTRFTRAPGMTNWMTSRTATLIGLTAILMWSLLAVLTVATGKIPAFQLAAMTFAIGALVGFLTWLRRPGAARTLRQAPAAWAGGPVCGRRRWHGSSGSVACSAITRCISWHCASRRQPKPGF